MNTHPPVTIARGRAPEHALEAGADVDCYHTEDGQIVLVLPDARPGTAAELAAVLDIGEPVVEVCDHVELITAAADPSSSDMDVHTGFHAWITMTTTIDQLRALADFNTAETRSTMRHLPGFRSVTLFLGRDRPTVTEHVIWESEQDYLAAERRPDFAEHHLRHIQQLTTAITWQRVWPC